MFKLITLILILGTWGNSISSAFSRVSKDLEDEIAKDYSAFRGHTVPRLKQQPCKAVQFIYYLQEKLKEEKNPRIAKKIAAIISEGAGVGGIDTKRQASEEEKKCIFQALYHSLQFPHDVEKEQPVKSLTPHESVIHNLTFVLRSFLPSDYSKGTIDFLTNEKLFSWLDSKIYTQERYLELSLTSPLSIKNHQAGDLNFQSISNVKQSKIYDNSYPNIPFFHTYSRLPGTHRVFMACQFKFEKYRGRLPENVKRRLANISEQEVDLYFEVQSIPKRTDSEINHHEIYRPHTWLNQNLQNYCKHQYFQGFGSVPCVFLQAAGNTVTAEYQITVSDFSHHTRDLDKRGYEVVISSNAPSIEHILKRDKEGDLFDSTVVWTIVKNPFTSRYAVTLHWLLNSSSLQRNPEAMNVRMYNLYKKKGEKIFNEQEFLNFIYSDENLKNLYHFAF